MPARSYALVNDPAAPPTSADAPSGAPDGAPPGADPAAPWAGRPWTAALVAAALIGGVFVHRASEREALRLSGGTLPGRASPPAVRGAPATGAAAPSERGGRPGAPPSAAPPSAAPPELEALAVEVFSEARPALGECLAEARRAAEGRAGKLPVTVVVDGRGLVVEVRLGPSPLREASFDECAELALLPLVFPEPLAARELSITFDLK